MSPYTVTWSTKIDAKSFDDAAVRALDILRDPRLPATVFHVEHDGQSCDVVLEPPDGRS